MAKDPEPFDWLDGTGYPWIDPPNWIDGVGYPLPDAPLHVWAWEFLRRNPDYRAFYAEKAAPYVTIRWIKQGRHRVKEYNLGMVATGKSWHNVHGEEILERFAIGSPFDPNDNYSIISLGPFHFPFLEPQYTLYGSWQHFLFGDSFQPTSKTIGFYFDLTRPLKGQFERALKFAKQFQTGVSLAKGRPRPTEYKLYLRILDALDSGKKRREIADILFEGLPPDYPQDARGRAFDKARRRALEMRQHGYRDVMRSN